MRTYFVMPEHAEMIRADNEQAASDYDARRDAADNAIKEGMSPRTAARKFRVPIGFCRYCARAARSR